MHQTPSNVFRSKRFIVPAGWQQLIDFFGLSINEFLAESSLPAEIREEQQFTLNTEEIIRFWDALERLVGCFQLVTGIRKFCEISQPPAVLAAICSPDVRSGLRRYGECKALTGPVSITLEDFPDHTAIVVDWLVPHERLKPSMVITTLAGILDVAQRGTGQRILPLRAECALAEEVPESFAVEHLGVPLTMGARMCLFFSNEAMQTPLRTCNQLTLQILNHYFEEAFSTQQSTRGQEVRLVLNRLLPVARGHLSAVATELACTSRQLQRELAAEGTSFSEVLTETRRELACQYLARARYSPTEVTFLLGYSEPAAFFRAFRKWTGETPVQFVTRTNEVSAAT